MRKCQMFVSHLILCPRSQMSQVISNTEHILKKVNDREKNVSIWLLVALKYTMDVSFKIIIIRVAFEFLCCSGSFLYRLHFFIV